MLHLITGTNGAGKTLHALKWVMERSKKENRPVCHNGRFKPKAGGPLESWKQIEFKDWQNEPDGTIFLIDECHNDLPNRATGAAVPDHVKMLAEHRRRGFDFYLISQHPANIDSFVRRLIGSPGWHRHIKRIWGQDFVSVLEWDSVNLNCEKANSSSTNGTSSQSKFPKEVYEWYESATIHTNKKKIPKVVWMFIIALCVIAFFTWQSYRNVVAIGDKGTKKETATAADGTATSAPAEKELIKLSAEDWMALRKPRLPEFPHTAAAYDDVTKPTTAPYPAACVQSKEKCKCYTQQATVMFISLSTCKQIVENGYFMDWQEQRQQQQPMQQPRMQQAQQQVDQQPSYRQQQAYEPSPELVGFEERMAARNATVVSTLKR